MLTARETLLQRTPRAHKKSEWGEPTDGSLAVLDAYDLVAKHLDKAN